MNSNPGQFIIFATLIISLMIIYMLAQNLLTFPKYNESKKHNDIAADIRPVMVNIKDNSTLGVSANYANDPNEQNQQIQTNQPVQQNQPNQQPNANQPVQQNQPNANPQIPQIPQYHLNQPDPQPIINENSTSNNYFLQNLYYLINPSNLNAPPPTTFVPYILKTPTPKSSTSVSKVTLTPASGIYTTSSSKSSITTFTPVSSNSTTPSIYLNNSSSDTSTPNNVSPSSLTTTSVPIYTYSNEPVSTVETPTPSNSSISTTPINTSTSTPAQISESFIEGIDSSTSSSNSPSTSSTNNPSISSTNNPSTSSTMTNSTKNINTTIPSSIATKPKNTYILHLTKDAQINSKLHFDSYEYISSGDLERIRNEIIVTPDTFTFIEGIDGDSSTSSTPDSTTSAGPIAGPIASQIVKGFPDFNSCANSAPTLPPNASNDFSGCSMLYITDCVGYYVYSAQFKNNTLIMQLNTDDNRKMTAGYYRLVI